MSGGNGGELGDGNTHSWWSLKDRLEISHALVGAIDAECAFYFGRYEGQVRDTSRGAKDKKESSLTSLL